jgi:hypothetical protein
MLAYACLFDSCAWSGRPVYARAQSPHTHGPIHYQNGMLPLPNARREVFQAPTEPQSLDPPPIVRSPVRPQLRGKGINDLSTDTLWLKLFIGCGYTKCTKLGLF